MSKHPKTGLTNSGFTLIEVLIAMALLSIMMVLLLGGMSTSVRNWDAGERRIKEVSKASASYNFFRRHLTTIQPFFDDFSSDESVFSFQGSRSSLQFVSALPASAGRLGIQVFVITLEPSPQDSNFIQVAIKPFYPTIENKSWQGDKVELIDHVESMEFDYYGLIEQDREKRWHSQWQNQQALPDIIKISITLNGGVVWPEIVVAPKIPHKNNGTSGENNPKESEDGTG